VQCAGHVRCFLSPVTCRLFPVACFLSPVSCRLSPIPLLPLRHPLGLLLGLLDDADIHKGVFRQVVPLAVADFFKAADGVVEFRDLAGLTGENLGHEERLRQEPLDPAGPMHH